MKHQIVFIPGLTYNKEIFSKQILHLADIAHCKVVINHMANRDKMADLISSAFSTGDIAVVTHSSVGCLPGYAAALKYPDRVKKLILLGACANFEISLVKFIQGVEQRIIAGELENVNKDIAAAALGSGHLNQADLADALSKTQTLGKETVLEQCQYLLKYAKIAGELKHIQAKTLIVQAEHDGFFKPSVSEEINRLIPESSRTVIPEIGHMISMENPGATSALIRLHLLN